MWKRLAVALMLGAGLGLAVWAEPAAAGVGSAEKEVEELREAWTQVIKFFENFVTELKSAVQTLDKTDQDLLAKYRALALQLKDLEAKLLQAQETFVQKSGTLEKALAECRAEVGALRATLEEVATGYQKADEALAQQFQAGLDGALAKLKEAETAFEAKISALKQESQETAAALNSRVEELSARVGALEAYDIGNLSRRVLSLEQAIQALQIKIENNREKIGALEKALGGFATDIAALKDTVTGLNTRVSDLEGRVTAVEESVGADIQGLTSRLDTLQALAVLGLLAGIGAIALVLLGIGG